jgi:hypothetical protein
MGTSVFGLLGKLKFEAWKENLTGTSCLRSSFCFACTTKADIMPSRTSGPTCFADRLMVMLRTPGEARAEEEMV